MIACKNLNVSTTLLLKTPHTSVKKTEKIQAVTHLNAAFLIAAFVGLKGNVKFLGKESYQYSYPDTSPGSIIMTSLTRATQWCHNVMDVLLVTNNCLIEMKAHKVRGNSSYYHTYTNE